VHARNDRHTAFRRATVRIRELHGVNAFDERQLSIPVGWWVTHEDRLRVAQAIRSWAHAEAGGQPAGDEQVVLAGAAAMGG
jgi:hypothetical protein